MNSKTLSKFEKLHVAKIRAFNCAPSYHTLLFIVHKCTECCCVNYNQKPSITNKFRANSDGFLYHFIQDFFFTKIF